jgi:pimeloyl-ACP methyl ester carboxylesterase
MTPGTPLLAPPPVAGGVELDLPGDGVRLRATRWPGAGPAVLLLHGLASTRHIWDLVVPHLAGTGAGATAVVALDQRGHGDSDRPAGPYDGATVVRDVLTALDAVGLSRVVVVGHSWGATTALRLAAQAPGRVLACVALDGGMGSLVGPDRPRARVRDLLTPPRTALPPDELMALVARGPLAPWWSDDVAAAVLPLFEVGTDGLARARLPFEAHMAVLDDLLDTEHEALWQRITCPTWLVACLPTPDGNRPHDDLAAAKEAGMQHAGRVLRSGRLLRWAGAVHDVPLQWPALVAGLVRAARDETVSTARFGEGRTA